MGETMNSPSRVLAAVAAVASLLAGSVLFAAPAQAATYVAPPAPSDGKTYVYGLPQAQFAVGRATKQSTYGGWLNSDWHKVSVGSNSQSTNPSHPEVIQLWDPYISGGTLSVTVDLLSLQDNQNGGNNTAAQASAGLGTVSGQVASVECQQTEWAVAGAPTNTSYPVGGSVSGSSAGFNGAGGEIITSYAAIGGSNLTACKYIREIDADICVYDTLTHQTCMIEAWYAGNVAVNPVPYRPFDPTRAVCALSLNSTTNPVSPACTDLLGSTGQIDGEDFSVVCANPPASWVWGDFSWLAGFVGFYAHCLFAAVNGWDRDHTVSTAWASGPAGQIVTPITNMVSSLNFPNSCGVIVPGTPGVLGGVFTVNTCSWSWAAQLHDALALILPAWFGWWALWFIVDAISGVINRKVPTPAQLGRE